MFPVAPPGMGTTINDVGRDFLECNGVTFNTADYPDLAAFLGATGSTFQVPLMTDTGRFPRSRTSSLAAGARLSNQNKTHTHVVSGNTGTISNDHTHTFSGTTGTDSPDHTHGFSASVSGSSTGGGSFAAGGPIQGSTTGGANQRHAHSFSGTTSGASTGHSHPISMTSATGSADGDEARPECIAFVFCIKT
nr:phage tail protein [Bradyrhizobium sp. KB893862 SZCCT0404]